MTSSESVGRLFPASRSGQRGSGIISQTITGSFFPNPSIFGSPKSDRKPSFKSLSLPNFPDVVWRFNKNFIKEKNRQYIGISDDKHKDDIAKLKKESQELKELFSKFATKNGNDDRYSVFEPETKIEFEEETEKYKHTTNPKVKTENLVSNENLFGNRNTDDLGSKFSNTRINPNLNAHNKENHKTMFISKTKLNEELASIQNAILRTNANSAIQESAPTIISSNQISTKDTQLRNDSNLKESDFKIVLRTADTQSEKSQIQLKSKPSKLSTVTNSPIYYIKLPPVPYEFHPSLGFISRPPSPDLKNFLRPQINFLNNGRPTSIYQPSTLHSPTEDSLPTTTLAFTTPDFLTSWSSDAATTTISTRETETSPADRITSDATTQFITTTPIPPTITTTQPRSTSTTKTSIITTANPLPTTLSTSATSSTTHFGVLPPKATTVRPSHDYTNSPITWLKGPYFFNGRPSNLFIFRSQKDKKKHFAELHKKYPKPGVYFR